jgi:glycosyltransferase involved in cell wall biosynthesis
VVFNWRVGSERPGGTSNARRLRTGKILVMVEISVVVPTYLRPDMLARAIASCLAQEDLDVPFEIVVVDNDPAGSARPQVEEMVRQSAVPIRYVGEPRPGISHARNTGVASAAGRYIAWLDDDEEATPGWLAAFWSTMSRSQADIVVGPHYPRLPPEQAQAYAGRIYTRDAHAPTGTVLASWDKLNGLFDKERCFGGDAQPFDLWLGITGGGDTLFFRRLIRAGRTIVWCAEGLVWETIPPERLAPRYVFRRRFHHGQITTFVRMAVKPVQPLGMAFWMAVGCAQVACYAPAALVLRLCNDERWVAAMGQAVGGLGKVLWHPKLHLRLYR